MKPSSVYQENLLEISGGWHQKEWVLSSYYYEIKSNMIQTIRY